MLHVKCALGLIYVLAVTPSRCITDLTSLGSPGTASLAVSLAPAPNGTRAKFTSDLLSADLITHHPRRSFNHPRYVAYRLERVERILRRKSFVGLPRLLFPSLSLSLSLALPLALPLFLYQDRELLISVAHQRARGSLVASEKYRLYPTSWRSSRPPRRDRERYRGRCCKPATRGCYDSRCGVLCRRSTASDCTVRFINRRVFASVADASTVECEH